MKRYAYLGKLYFLFNISHPKSKTCFRYIKDGRTGVNETIIAKGTCRPDLTYVDL